MLVFAVCGILPQTLGDLEAVEPRHHHVEQDEVGSQECRPFERDLTVAGDRHLVAGGAQVHLDEAGDVGIVVDDEDRLGHQAASPFAIARSTRAFSAGSAAWKMPLALISTVAPASTARRALSTLTPPSISTSMASPRRSISARTASMPRVDGRVEGLPAPARLDAHQHHVVDLVQVREDVVDRSLQVDRDTGAEARRCAPCRSR